MGKDTLDNALRADINHIGVESARITGNDARQEAGKARRVWERVDETDPLAL